MEEITLNVLYGELKEMHREIHALRDAIIPNEEISETERKEFSVAITEMQQGKEKNWRDVKIKR